jgi:hypothetical protein
VGSPTCRAASLCRPTALDTAPTSPTTTAARSAAASAAGSQRQTPGARRHPGQSSQRSSNGPRPDAGRYPPPDSARRAEPGGRGVPGRAGGRPRRVDQQGRLPAACDWAGYVANDLALVLRSERFGQASWRTLGNEGGEFGTDRALAARDVERRLAPLRSWPGYANSTRPAPGSWLASSSSPAPSRSRSHRRSRSRHRRPTLDVPARRPGTQGVPTAWLPVRTCSTSGTRRPTHRGAVVPPGPYLTSGPTTASAIGVGSYFSRPLAGSSSRS